MAQTRHMTRVTRARPLVDRIHDNVTISPDGCWLWQLKINRQGYGVIALKGSTKGRIHRVSFEAFIGPIPEGYEVDHVCHNDTPCMGGPTCLHRRCCNPAHLEAVTHAVNLTRGRTGQWKRQQITDCVDHVYVTTHSGGRVFCRACNRRRRAKHLARKYP
jgi:hypothetical protein